ncbi:hypothetical protein Dimus_019638 [Dionaea muscipula]
MFSVCSTWRAISGSELLWQNLTRRIWARKLLLHVTWRQEYIYRHRTSRNFRVRRYSHTTLCFSDGIVSPADNNNNATAADHHHLLCLRISLSDHHLAAGFSDGSVRLFSLDSHVHLQTFRPILRDRLGLFSPAVSGIILTLPRLTFASVDGDVHVSLFHNGGSEPGPMSGSTRRAHLGDVVNDGALVDFTGCHRFWVGLYAGVPGRAIHIWDGESEEPLYVGGTLTDPEAVMGWHMLTEWTSDFVGRVRVTGEELAVACTRSRVLVFDLRNEGMVVGGLEDARRGLIVGLLDADNEAFMTADVRGTASVRQARSLLQMCRFGLRGVGAAAAARGVLGCMNTGFALMCGGGVVRVWEIEHGEYLYRLRERIDGATALAADGRHVAGSGSDRTIIHLWDFGA